MTEDQLGPRLTEARHLARKIIKDAGIDTAPVSLWRVIKHLQTGYELYVSRVSVGTQIAGMLVTVEQEEREFSTIYFNQNHPWCRRRFTIGHEIGHLLMGHATQCVDGSNDASETEQEANAFAAELLIPLKLIKADYKKTPNIPTLAHQYQTSQQTMGIQLIQLRLVK
ncbi:ImmA/IrrE family metallo-endopeptidase [Candidatus Nomurabacteria bacterium]|nr:ImmA/IrrE family metallo-endopeptidase [Candidatus Nomurabacteria bacterium]